MSQLVKEAAHKRCFIATLGPKPDNVIKRLFTSTPPLQADDDIFIVTPPPTKSIMTAFNFLRSQLPFYGYYKEVRHIVVEPRDSYESLLRMMSEIRECKGKHVILELGEGPRFLALVLALLLPSLGFKVSIYTTSKEEEEAMPWGIVEFIKNGFERKSESRLLVAMLENEGFSSSQLAGVLRTKEKTVQNRISKLRRLGLVEKRGKGPPRLTLWGRIIASLIKIYGTSARANSRL